MRVDYTITQKVLHWLTALLLIMDLFVAQKFGHFMSDIDRFESRSDHAQVGLIITVFILGRLWLRWKYGSPPLSSKLPDWQQRVAHLAHWALYGLVGLLVVTGIISAIYANSVVSPFGWNLGSGVGNDGVYSLSRWIHEAATNALIILIVIHALAALHHVIMKRDEHTKRMFRFWKSTQP